VDEYDSLMASRRSPAELQSSQAIEESLESDALGSLLRRGARWSVLRIVAGLVV
jgi:hypothetical protein